MDTSQKVAMLILTNLKFLVVGILFVLMWLICAIMVRKEELLLKLVKGMDNGLLTFLTVVIINY